MHSTEKAKEAKENFVNRFSNGIISKEIEKIKISEANNWLELVNKLMPEESNSFIKRLFKQNAVKIDGNIAKDCNNKPIEGILNIGKVKMWRITNDS